MPSPPAQSLNDKVVSMETKLEKQQQELKAGQSLLPSSGLNVCGRVGRLLAGPHAGTSGLQGLTEWKPPRAPFPLPICVCPRLFHVASASPAADKRHELPDLQDECSQEQW